MASSQDSAYSQEEYKKSSETRGSSDDVPRTLIPYRSRDLGINLRGPEDGVSAASPLVSSTHPMV